MTQNEIVEAIKAERIRQDELHPVVAKKMLPEWTTSWKLAKLAQDISIENEENEYTDLCNWYEVFKEELYEIFAETDPVKIREEAIQLAALCVRLCENV